MRNAYLVFLVSIAACASHPASRECPSGIICPEGTQCAAVQAVCITNNCGNGIVDTGELCDDGNIVDGDGCAADCLSQERCGDHVVNLAAGEVCDDGNTVNGDGCSGDCRSLEACGNGIVDQGETCDDGGAHDGTCNGDGTTPCNVNQDCAVGMCIPDGCSKDCKSKQTCGNNIVDLGEACDDGNTVSGDSCESDCQSGVGCRNGHIDPGEECDDGNTVDTDDCHNNCKINICGDGIIDSSGNHHEDCDPSIGFGETAACNSDCTAPSCGDGKVNHAFKPDGVHGEECDLGTLAAVNQNADNKDCTLHCRVNVCGDGLQDTNGPIRSEGCDDGNAINNDGCRNDCVPATCGDSIVQSPEQCDDGNGVDNDACRNDCMYAFCGDGHQNNGEACDPTAPHVGGDSNGAALCNSDCTISACGDGKVNATAGEQCDDHNTNDNDGCLSSGTSAATKCKVATCGDGVVFTNVEQCDTGGASATCDADCTNPVCGDGVTNTNFKPDGVLAEQCDHGANNGKPGDTCDYKCRTAGCGNSIVETDEDCDTGGDSATCDNDCSLPVCGDGHTNGSFKPDGVHIEQCDAGINNTNDNRCPYNTSCANRCTTNCQTLLTVVPTCGDNFIDSGNETCDDGGATNLVTECAYPSTQPCEACHSCAIVLFPAQRCGDFVVQAGHEQCEPPNTTTCSATCQTPTCTDGSKDGLETDTDCGGSLCDGNGHKCVDTKACVIDNDCVNGYCDGTGHCQTPTCTDTVKNGNETDTDCGGPLCDGSGHKCADTLVCGVASDCQSGVCDGTNHCAVPTCTDTVFNGSETDLDCGGALCDGNGHQCTGGQNCLVNADCTSNNCNGSFKCVP